MIYESIVTNINARFAAWSVGVTCELGPEAVAEEKDLPRVIFIPTGAEFSTRDNVGIRGRNPQAMHSVEMGADVQIWGIDYDTTFQIMQQVVRALWLPNNRGIGTEGVYKISGGAWDNNIKIVRRGRLFTLQMSVSVPLVDVTWSFVPPYPVAQGEAGVGMLFPNDVVEGLVTVNT